jgi:manganese/iron transport system permease protein/iron/zinc/copper transport system permease protein
MNYVAEPLQFEFFRHAVIAATLVGALCGLMGTYVVLRKMSYIGHGLSHSVFGGAVVSYVIGWNFYLGAGIWGFLSALLINATARRRGLGADAAIGIVTTASFALGVAIISKGSRFTRNFEAALFGNILGVDDRDLYVVGGVLLVVAGGVFLGYKQLLFTTFDPELARVYGVPVEGVETGFALALAATIVASLNIVGVTLLAAAIVVPPATARLLTRSFGRLLLLSTGLGALYGLVGMFVSYWTDVASGAAIVLLATGGFAVAYVLSGLRRAAFPLRQTVAAPTPPPSPIATPALAAERDGHLFD